MSAPRILILDDEESLVAALVRHFERRGYEPTGAYLVAEATRAIEESVQTGRPFAAIVTDLQLPDGDGWAGAGNGLAALDSVRERFAGWHADILPSATAVGVLSQPRFEAGEGVAARDAHPIYVRHRVALTTAEREAGLSR